MTACAVQLLPVLDTVSHLCCESDAALDRIAKIHKLWIRFHVAMESQVCACASFPAHAATPCPCPCHCSPLPLQIPAFLVGLRRVAPVRFVSSWLSVLRVAVNEFGSSPVTGPALLECVVEFTDMTARELTLTPTACEENPDIVVEFFDLMRTEMKRQPVPFLNGPAFPTAVRLALHGLTLFDRGSVTMVRKFWVDLLGCCFEDFGAPVHAMLQAIHAQLIST